MHTLRVRNVHQALPEAISLLHHHGVKRESRNGTVLACDQPVTTMYERPTERVLFWPERDANPFFHFYEGLWMLGGRKDVASLARFVKRMTEFSDDGVSFHGAYGARWKWDLDGGHNQLALIAKYLTKHPTGRRAVLTMWETHKDLTMVDTEARDLPCNLVANFQIRDGGLDMTVFNRSNDIIWGCYGANAVHFSMLHEYMAAATNTHVGTYWHVSNNWHAYLATLEPLLGLMHQRPAPPYSSSPVNPYEESVTTYPMVNRDLDTWHGDLEMFLDVEHQALGYRDPFFRKVALPIVATHRVYKENTAPARYRLAIEKAQTIQAEDWSKAILEWLQRRIVRFQQRQEAKRATED